VEKTVTSARDVQSAITSSLADLNDQAVAGLQKWFQARNDDSVATNLFRYAIAMPNGGKRALFNLKPSDRGATAVVPGFGPAFEAGLQTGDEVLTMNGVPTAGMTQEQLSAALLTASAAGPYDLVIETADGKSQHITFESKPMSWLLAHRPSP
jgi:predicted metalloprotease with PDZ domain